MTICPCGQASRLDRKSGRLEAGKRTLIAQAPAQADIEAGERLSGGGVALRSDGSLVPLPGVCPPG